MLLECYELHVEHRQLTVRLSGSYYRVWFGVRWLIVLEIRVNSIESSRSAAHVKPAISRPPQKRVPIFWSAVYCNTIIVN